MPKKRDGRNLLELRPLRNIEWAEGEDDTVVLLVPRFRSAFARRWFVPMLKHPDVRVKTDRVGAFVWRRCDGKATVLEIAADLAREFGADFDPDHERISRFIRQLAMNDSIVFNQ